MPLRTLPTLRNFGAEMKRAAPAEEPRVAISLDLERAYKRHLQLYAGCRQYAVGAGWLCSVNPAIDRMLAVGADGRPNYDGIIAPAELVPRHSSDVYASEDPVDARALRYIAENSHRRIRVDHVAAAVATARRTLERRFGEVAGRTIADEITRHRLERAKRRIVETDAPMKDVAIDAGFRNADHFHKVFARVEGMPPSQYRAERQQVFPQRV